MLSHACSEDEKVVIKTSHDLSEQVRKEGTLVLELRQVHDEESDDDDDSYLFWEMMEAEKKAKEDVEKVRVCNELRRRVYWISTYEPARSEATTKRLCYMSSDDGA